MTLSITFLSSSELKKYTKDHCAVSWEMFIDHVESAAGKMAWVLWGIKRKTAQHSCPTEAYEREREKGAHGEKINTTGLCVISAT